MKLLLIGGLSFLFIITTSVAWKMQSVNSDEQFKADFINSINRARAKGCNCGTTYMPPAPPLTWNYRLELAARGHARDMAAQNYFSHTSKDGRTSENRIVQAGYIYKGYHTFTIGENIAFGQQNIAEVMTGWLHSEGHCKNLMNPGFKEVGVAENSKYWVQDFGGREAFSPEQQKLIRNGARLIIRRERQHE